MFENITKCLNKYESALTGENAKQGFLNEEEDDIVQYIEFYLAKALLQESFINAEKIAKFILVAKGLSGDIKIKMG